jgi:hypothetical protein
MKDAVVVGRSTRADVNAALGDTLAIRFENGYELWLYRLTGQPVGGRGRSRVPGESAEFVVLFGPSGVAVKSRVRAAPVVRE